MESCPENNFLKFHPDTFATVRRNVNLDKPGAMEDSVRILNEWVKQQAHFKTKDFPPEYLETTIIACKGSVEKSKVILDKVCTARTLFPDAFKPFNMRKEYESILKGKIYEVVLPKMTEDNIRLVIIKINNFKSDLLNCLYKFKYADTFAVRVKKIHVITPSKLVEPLLMMIKSFLKKKIADRIVVNKSVEELCQYYPKEILPKDYGGYDKSLEEIQERYLDDISTEKYLEFMKTMYETRTDESLRSVGTFNELYAGMAGTFRALSVD